MKITIFSSNQSRHLNLVRELSHICEDVYFISEIKTLFPGVVDDKIPKSEMMKVYFSNVVKSEKKIFGDINFLPRNVHTLGIKSGDLSKLRRSQLETALHSDLYIIFGASYIKGWLVDFLLDREALNIHLGVSPYYRGTACNFWALYDNNPGYVGATIHYLSRGLDSGDILFHCMPNIAKDDNPFDFTMRSVQVAQVGLISKIKGGLISGQQLFPQDISKEIRYSRNQDFNDQVAKEFLQRTKNWSPEAFSYPELYSPIFG